MTVESQKHQLLPSLLNVQKHLSFPVNGQSDNTSFREVNLTANCGCDWLVASQTLKDIIQLRMLPSGRGHCPWRGRERREEASSVESCHDTCLTAVTSPVTKPNEQGGRDQSILATACGRICIVFFYSTCFFQEVVSRRELTSPV